MARTRGWSSSICGITASSQLDCEPVDRTIVQLGNDHRERKWRKRQRESDRKGRQKRRREEEEMCSAASNQQSPRQRMLARRARPTSMIPIPPCINIVRCRAIGSPKLEPCRARFVSSWVVESDPLVSSSSPPAPPTTSTTPLLPRSLPIELTTAPLTWRLFPPLLLLLLLLVLFFPVPEAAPPIVRVLGCAVCANTIPDTVRSSACCCGCRTAPMAGNALADGTALQSADTPHTVVPQSQHPGRIGRLTT